MLPFFSFKKFNNFFKGALLLLPLVLAPHPPSTMIALASLPLATLIIGATAQVLIL